MRRYIFLCFFWVLVTNCTNRQSDASIILDKAFGIIEQQPDSSLAILNNLHLNNLPTQEERARYALLKSMALDKNYIDVTSDSLTSIAVDYYASSGAPDERLKAYYYHGKVFINSGNYEKAIENFIIAESYVESSLDFIAIGRLYNAKMWVYKSIFDMEKAIKPAELSVKYYLQGKDTVRYITALNSLSAILLAANKFESLEETFMLIKSLEGSMTLKHKKLYYENLINYKLAIKDTSLRNVLGEYIVSFTDKQNLINWLIIARAYNELKDHSKALEALNNYKIFNQNLEELYYFISSEIYGALQDYENAYEFLRFYHENSSKEDLKILQSDAKFLEERYSSEQHKLKQKYIIVMLVLSIVLILIIIISIAIILRNIFIRRANKLLELEEQKIRLTNEYEKAIIEQNRLRSLISNNKISKDLRKVIEERMIILNSFIVSNISGINLDKSMIELKKYIDDNENFLQSTMLSFKLTHPKFISFLQNKGLSDWEVGCCCLYCIGLNGSEISNFLDIKYFYKRSSVIRRKLGVQSVNIDTYLLNKMKELQ